MFACLHVCLSVCPSVHPSVRLSVRPSVCPPVRPFVHPSVRPSVHLSDSYLFILLSTCRKQGNGRLSALHQYKCCTVTRSLNAWMPPTSITLPHILGSHTIKDNAVIYGYNSSASSTAQLLANFLVVLASRASTGLSRRAATDDDGGRPMRRGLRFERLLDLHEQYRTFTWTSFTITGHTIYVELGRLTKEIWQ